MPDGSLMLPDETAADLRPAELGGTVDSTGKLVGYALDSFSVTFELDDGRIIRLTMSREDFASGGVSYTSTDCSGLPLGFPVPGDPPGPWSL